MKLQFESRFEKDLRAIKDRKLLLQIKDVIVQCRQAADMTELKNVKKLQGHDTFYRIRLGDYRIGLELSDDTLIFTRFLHRKEVYRYFP